MSCALFTLLWYHRHNLQSYEQLRMHHLQQLGSWQSVLSYFTLILVWSNSVWLKPSWGVVVSVGIGGTKAGLTYIYTLGRILMRVPSFCCCRPPLGIMAICLLHHRCRQDTYSVWCRDFHVSPGTCVHEQHGALYVCWRGCTCYLKGLYRKSRIRCRQKTLSNPTDLHTLYLSVLSITAKNHSYAKLCWQGTHTGALQWSATAKAFVAILFISKRSW